MSLDISLSCSSTQDALSMITRRQDRCQHFKLLEKNPLPDLLPTGLQTTRQSMMINFQSHWQGLRDLSGPIQDRPIHLREAISTPNIRSPWEPLDITQEINLPQMPPRPWMKITSLQQEPRRPPRTFQDITASSPRLISIHRLLHRQVNSERERPSSNRTLLRTTKSRYQAIKVTNQWMESMREELQDQIASTPLERHSNEKFAVKSKSF